MLKPYSAQDTGITPLASKQIRNIVGFEINFNLVRKMNVLLMMYVTSTINRARHFLWWLMGNRSYLDPSNRTSCSYSCTIQFIINNLILHKEGTVSTTLIRVEREVSETSFKFSVYRYCIKKTSTPTNKLLMHVIIARFMRIKGFFWSKKKTPLNLLTLPLRARERINPFKNEVLSEIFLLSAAVQTL